MTFSKLDKFYRSTVLSKYFIKGWGTAENLKSLLLFRKIVSNRNDCTKLVGEYYPLEFTKDQYEGDIHVLEGLFQSPFNFYLPSLLPKESKEAYFQMILPRKWKDDDYKPVCIHMAGTGDHYFWRRRHLMAKPLLREAGIGSIILENPFYGTRKPVYQIAIFPSHCWSIVTGNLMCGFNILMPLTLPTSGEKITLNIGRSVLNNVSDIFVMGGCLILEALVLLQWCTRKGLGPLGISGLSMGGHMASLAATNWPYPLVLVPCLSWSTASGVFTEGVMSRAINWDMLQCQYKENEAFRTELYKMVQIRESDAFQAGKEFVKNFPESMLPLKPDSCSGAKQELTNSNPKTFPKKLVNFLKVNSNKTEDSTKFTSSLEKILYSKNADHTSNKHEAINFMRGIMDECTHLKNFSIPVDTSLIISVCARDDGYVPREGVSDLSEIWPGADVRFIDAGHVSAFVLHQKEFRHAIIEAFERYKAKYILH